MEGFVIELGWMSVRATIVIGAVLLIRWLLDRAHIAKKYMGWLWLLPCICLIIPWRMESDLSFWKLFQETKATFTQNVQGLEGEYWIPLSDVMHVPQREIGQVQPENILQENLQINVLNATRQDAAERKAVYEKRSVQEVLSNVTLPQILCVVWSTGVLVMMGYAVVSYVKLRRKVMCSKVHQDNIYLADDIEVPFVLGILHPRIYLPSDVQIESAEYVIEHEKTHILRKDYMKKIVAFVVASVHWFNPFVWMAFYYWEKDMEMACDEETILRIGIEKRWDYANVLLLLSVGKKEFSILPVAFSEGDIKGRIRNVCKNKNAVKWIAGVMVLLVAILAVVFLTKPSTDPVDGESTQATKVEDSSSNVGNDKSDAESILEGATEVEVIPAKEVTEEILCGSDGPSFDYLDTEWFEQIIFHDYYGLFVYNLNWGEGIVRSLDLEAIGCNYTQGDSACEVKVSEDGQLVYLKPMNAEEGYIYDVEADKLYRKAYDMASVIRFDGFTQTSQVALNASGLKSSLCYIRENSKYCHYLLSETGLARDLRWRVDWVDAENGLTVCEQDDRIFAAYTRTESIEENIPHLEELCVQLHKQYSNFLAEVEKLQVQAEGPITIIGAEASYTEQIEKLQSSIELEKQALQNEDTSDQLIEAKKQELLLQLEELEKQLQELKSIVESGMFEKIKQTEREFTMMELIQLCESGRDNMRDVMEAQVDNCFYTNFVREESKGSVNWDYLCDLPYEGKEYRLQVSYRKEEHAQGIDLHANQLAAIYLMETSSTDTRCLYYYDADPSNEDIDIRSFLALKHTLDYISLDLPEGLSMGNYTVDLMDTWDGCVFIGDVEEPMHGDWCPEAWYAPGGIGVSRPENYGERATFEDGKLVSVSWGMNHGERTSDFEHVDGCSMEAVICEYAFDTFTAAESEEYKEKYNLSDADIQTISNYWYVFLAEEESGFVFCTFLNQQYYDKEDAIALAKSVILQQ